MEDCAYSLEVFDGSEICGLGTGFTIDETGTIVTAAHVVSNRLPVRREDIKDPDLFILAVSRHGEVIPYEVVICGVNVNDQFIRKPFTLDFCILRPKKRRPQTSHLKIEPVLPRVGETVFMSGFSEDMEVPFGFTKNLKPEDFPYPEKIFAEKLQRINRLLMHKSGMIGSTYNFDATDSEGSYEISASVIYIDNVMHCGASGGPIVNTAGRVVGLIVDRSTVELNYDPDTRHRIPSGIAVGLSIHFIRPFYPALIGHDAIPIFATMTFR